MVVLGRGRARLVAIASILVAFFTFVNVYDYRVFRNWLLASNLMGILDIYAASGVLGHAFRVVYPPLAPLLFIATASLAALLYPFYPLTPYPPLVARLLLKTPLLASLIAAHYILETRVSREAARLFTFNILVILLIHAYVFEFPAIALTLAALYAPTLLLSAAFLAAATLLKQNFALLALPLLLYYARRDGPRGAALFATAYIAILAALLVPFTLYSGLQPILQSLLEFHAARPPQGTNIWTIFLVDTGYDAELAMKVSKLWIAFFAVLAGVALYRLGRSVEDTVDVERLSAALMVALLASSKVLNPHYILWALPFIAVLAARGVITRRAYIAYTAAGLIELLYPVFTMFGAAALHRPFYIEEEARWMTPTEVEKLVIDAMPSIAPALLDFVRHTPLITLFQLVYDNWPLILPLLSTTYTALMLYVYAELVRNPRATGVE